MKQSGKKLKDDDSNQEMTDLVYLTLNMLVKVQGSLSKNQSRKKYCIYSFCEIWFICSSQ